MKPIANTVLVEDVSGSMNDPIQGTMTKLSALKQANLILLEHKRKTFPMDRVGCVLFNDSASVLFNLTESHNPDAARKIQQIQADGMTNMAEGLRLALELLVKRPGRFLRNIVLLSDGFANVGDNSQLIPLAQKARSLGITINTVGFGRSSKDFDEGLLKSLSRNSRNGHYLHVNDLRPLASALVSMS